MEWAKLHSPTSEWLASFACDTPLIPRDLVEILKRALQSQNAVVACARSNQRSHPTIALWSIELADKLRQHLEEQLDRKLEHWTKKQGGLAVDFTVKINDPFLNINTIEDLANAEQFF